MRSIFVKILTAFTILLIGGYVLLYLYGETGVTKDNVCSECSRIKEQAVKQKDLQICLKIPEEDAVAECKLEVIDAQNAEFALRYRDKAYCLSIETSQGVQECLYKLALDTDDYALCPELTGTFKDSCYAEYAEKTKNPEICLSNIKNDFYRDTCVKKIAAALQEQQLCKQISSEGLVLGCIADIIYRKKGYPECAGLDEETCLGKEDCSAEYAPEDCLGCHGKVFLKCSPLPEKLCLLSGGSYDERCICENKALINGFCLDCNDVVSELQAACQRQILP